MTRTAHIFITLFPLGRLNPFPILVTGVTEPRNEEKISQKGTVLAIKALQKTQPLQILSKTGLSL